MTTAMLARKRRQDAPAVVDDVATLFHEHEAAIADLGRLEAERVDLVLDGTEDAVIALDAEMARVRIRIDRVSLQHARAVQAQAEARVAEDRERQRALYRRGQAAVTEARQLYERDYVDQAKALAGTLRRIAELEAEVAAANRNLPADMPRLASPEPDSGMFGLGHGSILNRVCLPGVGRGAPAFTTL